LTSRSEALLVSRTVSVASVTVPFTSTVWYSITLVSSNSRFTFPLTESRSHATTDGYSGVGRLLLDRVEVTAEAGSHAQ
jgi:hypothetical protein